MTAVEQKETKETETGKCGGGVAAEQEQKAVKGAKQAGATDEHGLARIEAVEQEETEETEGQMRNAEADCGV